MLPLPVVEAQNGSGSMIDQLGRALPAGTDIELVEKLINASNAGEQAVTDAVALAINGAFQPAVEEEQS